MTRNPTERLSTWERGARGELEELLKVHMDRADGLEIMLARALLAAAREARETWTKLFSKMVRELPRDLDTGFEITGTPRDPRLAGTLRELEKAYTARLLEARQAVEEITNQAFGSGEELALKISELGEGRGG